MATNEEYFTISIDNSQLLENANETISMFSNIGVGAQQAGDVMDAAMSAVSKTATNAMKIVNAAISEAVPADAFAAALGEIESAIESAKNEVNSLSESMQSMPEGEELENTKSRIAELNAQIQEATALYDGVVAGQQEYNSSLAATEQEAQKYNNTLIKLVGGEERYNEILNALPPEIRGVISGISSMTSASKAFIATPIGAVLAAIALALSAVTTWFKGSSEGEMEFAKITGYASGILDQLKEIVIAVGKAIYSAFTDPKKAVSDLWKAIQTNLVNRVKGLGETFKVLGEMIGSVFSGDFDSGKWSEMGKKLADATVMTASGIEDLSKKVENYTKNVTNAAKKSAEYNQREMKLNQERRKASLEEKDIDIELKKLQDQMYKNGANKAAIRAKAEELVNKKINTQLKLAKEELAIQQGRMDLTTNTEADYDKEAELKGRIKDIERERYQEMMRFNRQAESYNKTQSSAAAKSVKADAKNENSFNMTNYKNAQKIAETERQIQNAITDAKIEAMEEGEAKVLAQYEHQAELERQSIEKLKQDALNDKIESTKAAFDSDNGNGNKVFDIQSVKLTDEELKQYDELTAAIEAKLARQKEIIAKSSQESMNEYLKEYGSYTQQMQAITDIYTQKINTAKNEGERSSLTAQMMNDISNMQSSYRESLTELSANSIQSIIEGLKKVQQENIASFSPVQAEAFQSQIEALNLEIAERNPFTTMKAAAEELKTNEQEVKDAVQELADAQADVINAQANLASAKSDANGAADTQAVVAAEEALVKAKERESAASQKVNAATNKEVKTRNKLKKATNDSINCVNKLISALEDVGNVIGGTVGDIIGVVGTISNVVTSSIQAMNMASESGANAIKAVERASVILAIISAALEAAQKIYNLVAASHDEALQKSIDKMQKSIEVLQDSYKLLEKQVEKTFSSVKESNIEKQIQNQRAQITLISKQMAAERQKKSTDNDTIKEYQDKIKELNENIKELRESAKDAIFGEDITASIENFADAYAEAWTNGESKVKSAKETVRDLMRQMVTESIKSAIQASSAMEQIREKLREFYADNVLTGWEQNYIYSMADALQKELDDQFSWASNLMSGTGESSTNSAGGFATASQESVDELNGRFTAMQMSVNSMESKLDVILTADNESADHLLNIRLQTEESVAIGKQAVNYLSNIEKHTRELYQMNERLGKIEENTRTL